MVQLGAVAVVTISVLLMKPLPIVLCLRRRAPHHCGDPDPFRTIGGCLWFSEATWFSEILESLQTWRFFQYLDKLLVYAPMVKSCHHEKWLHLHFVDWCNQWNHQAHYNGNIRLKERPASSGNGAPRRSIREVLSDHSLSS